MHCAVQMGHLDTIELLLSYGAEIEAKDRNQYTPLHVASANGTIIFFIKTEINTKFGVILQELILSLNF